MRKSKSNIMTFIEIGVNLMLLPLFHIKFFHEVAVVPGMDAEGNMITVRTEHYYSIVDNLKYDFIPWVWISVALIITSIFYCALSFIIKHKNMKTASHIISVCSIVFFLLVFFLASLVSRDY